MSQYTSSLFSNFQPPSPLRSTNAFLDGVNQEMSGEFRDIDGYNFISEESTLVDRTTADLNNTHDFFSPLNDTALSYAQQQLRNNNGGVGQQQSSTNPTSTTTTTGYLGGRNPTHTTSMTAAAVAAELIENSNYYDDLSNYQNNLPLNQSILNDNNYNDYYDNQPQLEPYDEDEQLQTSELHYHPADDNLNSTSVGFGHDTVIHNQSLATSRAAPSPVHHNAHETTNTTYYHSSGSNILHNPLDFTPSISTNSFNRSHLNSRSNIHMDDSQFYGSMMQNSVIHNPSNRLNTSTNPVNTTTGNTSRTATTTATNTTTGANTSVANPKLSFSYSKNPSNTTEDTLILTPDTQYLGSVNTPSRVQQNTPYTPANQQQQQNPSITPYPTQQQQQQVYYQHHQQPTSTTTTPVAAANGNTINNIANQQQMENLTPGTYFAERVPTFGTLSGNGSHPSFGMTTPNQSINATTYVAPGATDTSNMMSMMESNPAEPYRRPTELNYTPKQTDLEPADYQYLSEKFAAYLNNPGDNQFAKNATFSVSSLDDIGLDGSHHQQKVQEQSQSQSQIQQQQPQPQPQQQKEQQQQPQQQPQQQKTQKSTLTYPSLACSEVIDFGVVEKDWLVERDLNLINPNPFPMIVVSHSFQGQWSSCFRLIVPKTYLDSLVVVPAYGKFDLAIEYAPNVAKDNYETTLSLIVMPVDAASNATSHIVGTPSAIVNILLTAKCVSTLRVSKDLLYSHNLFDFGECQPGNIVQTVFCDELNGSQRIDIRGEGYRLDRLNDGKVLVKFSAPNSLSSKGEAIIYNDKNKSRKIVQLCTNVKIPPPQQPIQQHSPPQQQQQKQQQTQQQKNLNKSQSSPQQPQPQKQQNSEYGNNYQNNQSRSATIQPTYNQQPQTQQQQHVLDPTPELELLIPSSALTKGICGVGLDEYKLPIQYYGKNGLEIQCKSTNPNYTVKPERFTLNAQNSSILLSLKFREVTQANIPNSYLKISSPSIAGESIKIVLLGKEYIEERVQKQQQKQQQQQQQFSKSFTYGQLQPAYKSEEEEYQHQYANNDEQYFNELPNALSNLSIVNGNDKSRNNLYQSTTTTTTATPSTYNHNNGELHSSSTTPSPQSSPERPDDNDEPMSVIFEDEDGKKIGNAKANAIQTGGINLFCERRLVTFGGVPLGESKSQRIRMSAEGTGEPLYLEASFVNKQENEFHLSSTAIVITPGKDYFLDIEYSPMHATTHSNVIAIKMRGSKFYFTIPVRGYGGAAMMKINSPHFTDSETGNTLIYINPPNQKKAGVQCCLTVKNQGHRPGFVRAIAQMNNANIEINPPSAVIGIGKRMEFDIIITPNKNQDLTGDALIKLYYGDEIARRRRRNAKRVVNLPDQTPVKNRHVNQEYISFSIFDQGFTYENDYSDEDEDNDGNDRLLGDIRQDKSFNCHEMELFDDGLHSIIIKPIVGSAPILKTTGSAPAVNTPAPVANKSTATKQTTVPSAIKTHPSPATETPSTLTNQSMMNETGLRNLNSISLLSSQYPSESNYSKFYQSEANQNNITANNFFNQSTTMKQPSQTPQKDHQQQHQASTTIGNAMRSQLQQQKQQQSTTTAQSTFLDRSTVNQPTTNSANVTKNTSSFFSTLPSSQFQPNIYTPTTPVTTTTTTTNGAPTNKTNASQYQSTTFNPELAQTVLATPSHYPERYQRPEQHRPATPEMSMRDFQDSPVEANEPQTPNNNTTSIFLNAPPLSSIPKQNGATGGNNRGSDLNSSFSTSQYFANTMLQTPNNKSVNMQSTLKMQQSANGGSFREPSPQLNQSNNSSLFDISSSDMDEDINGTEGRRQSLYPYSAADTNTSAHNYSHYFQNDNPRAYTFDQSHFIDDSINFDNNLKSVFNPSNSGDSDQTEMIDQAVVYTDEDIIEFGDIKVGGMTNSKIGISNASDHDIYVTLSDPSDPFFHEQTEPIKLQFNKTTRIPVFFKPNTEGEFVNHIHVTSMPSYDDEPVYVCEFELRGRSTFS